MIEIKLNDGRVLTFDKGAQTMTHPGIPHVLSGNIFSVKSSPYSEFAEAAEADNGADFILGDPRSGGPTLAVELKTGLAAPSKRSSSALEFRSHWAKKVARLSRTYSRDVPIELWLLSRDARRLMTWKIDRQGDFKNESDYRLVEVSSRDEESPDVVLSGGTEVDTPYIARMVDDWEKRIETIYQEIGKWSRSMGLKAYHSGKVLIYEDLMERFGVPQRELNTFAVDRDGRAILTVKPYGLWVIGSNGRLDVFSKGESYFLLDRAERLQPPKWELFGRGNFRILGKPLARGVEFNREVFEALTDD